MISATHLHAMIIHFQLLTGGWFYYGNSLRYLSKMSFLKNTAFYLLLLGSLGAIAAYVTGSYAGEGVEEGPLKIPMELHEQAALITLWLSIITALFSVLIYFFKVKNVAAKWAIFYCMLYW